MNGVIELLQQLGGDAAQAAIAQWERFKLAFKIIVTAIVLLTLALLAIGWVGSAFGFGWINYIFVVLYTIGWLVFAFWPTHLVVTFVLGVVMPGSLNLTHIREGVKRAAEIHVSIIKYILFGGAITFGFLGLFKVGFLQGLAMMGLTFVMLIASWFFGLKSKWPARIIVTIVGIALTLTFLEILFPGFDGGLSKVKRAVETNVSGAVQRTADPQSLTCTVTLPAEKFWEEHPLVCNGKKDIPEGKFRMDIQDVQLKILEGSELWSEIESLKVSGAASPKSLFSRYRGSGTPTTRDWAFLINGIPSGENVVITADSKFSLNINEAQRGGIERRKMKLDRPVQILVKLEQ